ncbi:hypothetical protein L2E82_19904 [Cichorium intybus]|uniref:Uncharacterized protein n=1 Tax=Cichorium intybus TaxID=13427 RepID=A0ACB9DRW2_CICIN|nr:hypothetical protein L2E82_19904 [Cichorium intybus]
MGLSISCPFTAYTYLDTTSKFINLEENEVKSSFENMIEGSVISELSSQETELDYAKMKEMCNGLSGFDNVIDEFTKTSIFDPGSPEHEAAIKLQKVYKSFRTRRKLANCAVQFEQSLWKLLDFAELKRSSISFFNFDK